MVMMDDVMTPSKPDPKQQETHQGVPLDEVLGEAEARFGPMPACLRSALLQPPPSLPNGHPSVHASILTGPSDAFPGTDPSLIHNGLGPSEPHGTGQTIATDDQHEGIISLDDIALMSLSSSSSPKDTHLITQDHRSESQMKSNTIFLDLDDDYDDHARRSPDSGCSMSEASAEDKVSIASTVSASSDDGGLSRLGGQIQRLRQAMSELREQDVALARQLLIVYDYVEETKWFLENFEACDPRHSMSGLMSSTERRFSQNFQKRLSDFGLKGIPHTGGFATPPSWTELNGCQATTKRHSRNISDGMITVEHLRRIYHENNNNATAVNHDVGETPEAGDDVNLDGPIVDRSGSTHRSPRPSIARRSVSSSFLEININTVKSDMDIIRHHGPLSPISDSGKIPAMTDDGDVDNDDDADNEAHLQTTPLPRTNSLEKLDCDTIMTCDDERTCESDVVLFKANQNDHVPVNAHLTSSHHRGSPSSSSASSMMSMQSSCSSTSSASSTDTYTRSNITQNTCRETNVPPVSSDTPLADPTAEDCSIFIADDSPDYVSETNKHLMSSFESHMSWLQEQDETLL